LSDIVERLGYHREHQVTGRLVLANPDGPEAADEIVRLRAERDEQRSLANGRMAALIAAEEERAAAEAERDRLRDALTKARANFGAEYDETGRILSVSHGSMLQMVLLLDAALKGDTP
jgi:hypothetical protein